MTCRPGLLAINGLYRHGFLVSPMMIRFARAVLEGGTLPPEAAGVVRAATVVTALPEDASNVFITLTARNLNPSVQILARANRRSTA